jgi:hypothetical protein
MKCIETDFQDFCNIENYVYKKSETYNVIDGKKIHICNEDVFVNMLYETNAENTQTYTYQLAFNHRNIQDNLEYYKRCISRLHTLLKSDEKKIYIHFHPIIGINDFNRNKTQIVKEFHSFHSYILTKTNNIFGVYFITVNAQSIEKISDILERSDTYAVYVIYCNEDFLDGGDPCMGNCKKEQDEMIQILQTYVEKDLENSS